MQSVGCLPCWKSTLIILPRRVNISRFSLSYTDALPDYLLGSLFTHSFIASLRLQIVCRDCPAPRHSIPDIDIKGIIGFAPSWGHWGLQLHRCFLLAPDHTPSPHSVALLRGYCPRWHTLPSFTLALPFPFLLIFLYNGGVISESWSGQKDLCFAISKSKVCSSPFLTTFDVENVGGISQV